MNRDTDSLTQLVAYAPGEDDLEREWPTARRAAMRSDIQARPRGSTAAVTRPVRLRSHTIRWRLAAALGAAAAAAALFVAQVVLPAQTPGGPSHAAAAALHRLATAARSAPSDLVRDGQFRYLVDKQSAGSTQESWTSYTGQTWRRDAYYDGTVIYYRSPKRGNDLLNPSPEFLASLPTDPADLQAYLRAHLSGSTSIDEAVFVWVGDTLRLGYAQADLRAAAIEVLERTPHITVGSSRDGVGRQSVRVTFVDEDKRPGESNALFFDPRTSELLQETQVFAGQASTTTYTDSGVVDSVPPTVFERAANPNQPGPPPPLGVGGQATATPSR